MDNLLTPTVLLKEQFTQKWAYSFKESVYLTELCIPSSPQQVTLT